MPQDSSKSVVYRSFFSCDDPKGVTESKTSRKSKSVFDSKVNVQRKQKNLDISFSRDQVSKGPTEDLENSSSVQLMEVSREAHKLNQVIDTWSKGLNFDSQSKDIAKDLLKGALDLQESLTMLGKLQEASKYMVKLKKKHKEKANNDDGGKFEGGAGIERSVSDRFGYRDNKMDFQKPRLSADGSSRDCYEELREVIRLSFAKQNLLPKEEKGCFSSRKSYSEERACSDRTKPSYNEEKTYFERLRSDVSLDYPSTSSSHSSTFRSNEFDSFDSSLSRSQEQKPKGPNVIAKLMGLEEIPSKPCQSNTEKGKQLNHVKPIFDIDLPKARKPSCSFQKVDTQRRTLEELIETVEFQGLVSNKSIDGGSKHHKRGHFDDAPPIVIMKPLNFSISFEEEFQKQKYMREDLYRKDIIRKWKMEKAVPPKRVHDGKGALDLSEIQRRLQAEMSPLKRLSKDEREKDFGDVLKNSEERVIKQSSTRIKASAPVKTKMQNKVDKNQRIAAGKREPIEVDSAKSKNASKLQNANKPSSTSPQKPEREQNFSRTRVSQQKGTSSSSTSEYSKLTASHTPNIRRKKIAKNEKETSTLVSTLKVERQCRNEDTQTEPMCEDKHEVTVTKITSPEQRPGEVKSSLDLDNGKSSESQLCDSTKMIIHDKSALETNRDANYNMSYISAVKMIICKRDDITRDLLLGNSSFLNQAEELFHFNHFNAYQHIMPQTTNLLDDGVADTKLLLDCAKELLEYKSLQCTLAAHPLTHTTLERSKLIISVEHLVDEICKGIEDLQSYHKLSAESLSADTLSTVLQKDLWCRGVVSGSWDLGWRYGFSLDDIEQVILETEQTVFSGIIEDVLADLQISPL